MAFFSQEEEKVRLNKFSIIHFAHKKDTTAREIISYYETANNNSYQHYASEWRKIDLDMSDKTYKQHVFDLICAAIIDDNITIHDMCESDLEKLNFKYDDIDFNELDSVNDDIEFGELKKIEFGFKMIYSEYWPSNAIRLKAYSDKQSVYYEDGKLANFEYYLRSIYQQRIISDQLNIEEETANYNRDISIYRDTFFEKLSRNIHENNYYLQVEPKVKNFEYTNDEHVIYQAIEDGSMPSGEINYNFFIAFQASFNKILSKHALEVKQKSVDISSKEMKHILQTSKLREIEVGNRYSELFNLYMQNFTQTFDAYASLTLAKKEFVDVKKMGDYPLSTFFDEVDETFEDILHSSLNDMVIPCVNYYEKNNSDDYIINTEKQIRNYYQGQLTELFSGSQKGEIQKQEIPILEEYKEKTDEFRNLCMQKIEYSFPKYYLPINKYSDYSFSIGDDFTGLDKRAVIEWAMEAGRKSDLSLHSISLIRLKISEFININCMNGDRLSGEEDLGPHDLHIIMERYAMTEQRLLVFGKGLIEIYIQYLRRNYFGEVNDSEWKVFEDRVEDLLNQPLSTYFDTNFDIATVEEYATDDKEHYDSAEDTPFFTKMKNIAQQKIYDVNDRYGNDIELAKSEYVKTGKRVDLNIMFQNLRVEIDRIVDEYFNMANYYIKEFKNKTLKNEITFDKGKYYHFQSNDKVKGQK